ncbi:MAG TPA: IclR family transcriptional regulator [Syntrophales bacterium]|nr:IclR family transcriptional regulator [Syntrophales bacterium]
MAAKLSNPKPGNLIQTIERVSLILDMVGQNPQGTTIKDLSGGLGLPKGTIHRILSSLCYFGYVRQDPETKNYSLGLKLMELGALLGSQLDLRKVAEPVLRDLVEKTGEAAHMVILDRNEIVYIDKIEARQTTGGLVMSSRVGARNPAHSCAVGKVLLSHLSDKALDSLIREKGLSPRTANTITDPRLLKSHLEAVRRQGYAIDEEENERGIRCLAAPIFDGRGRPVAAISVSGPAVRVTRKVIQDVFRKEVMQAASEISRRLGFKGRIENGSERA